MTKPTPEEMDRGYSLCDCGKIFLHQAGYELQLHNCGLCGQFVCTADEFFRKNESIEIMSK